MSGIDDRARLSPARWVLLTLRPHDETVSPDVTRTAMAVTSNAWPTRAATQGIASRRQDPVVVARSQTVSALGPPRVLACGRRVTIATLRYNRREATTCVCSCSGGSASRSTVRASTPLG